MEENVLTRLIPALTTGSIRVVDSSQPLDAGTPTIALPPEFGKSWPFRLEEISRDDSRGPACIRPRYAHRSLPIRPDVAASTGNRSAPRKNGGKGDTKNAGLH